MSNYRETFVVFESEDGEQHRFSAYQVKTVRGKGSRTTITYRDEDQVVRFTTLVDADTAWQQIAASLVEFV